MNKALAFFMGTDCGGGRCEKCEGVFVKPRGMPLNPTPTLPHWGRGFSVVFRASVCYAHYPLFYLRRIYNSSATATKKASISDTAKNIKTLQETENGCLPSYYAH